MPSSVPIRVRKETRDRLHSIKNPGQSLDGIITQMIDLWERQKAKEAQAKTKWKWKDLWEQVFSDFCGGIIGEMQGGDRWGSRVETKIF